MDIKKVVVCGGGVLGAQIALQAQYCGFDTTIWLRSEGSIERAKPRLERFTQERIKDLDILEENKSELLVPRGLVDSLENFDHDKTVEKVKKAHEDLKLETDKEKAFDDCDLIIEAMTENLDQKKDFYQSIREYLPEKTIICTNSSSLLPSSFMKDTGREEKFLALHFANDIHKLNTAEVMRTSKTSDEAFDTVVKFSEDIRMVPIKLKKEKEGYILNSLLIPFMLSAGDLYATGVADVEDIDNTWKIATGAPMGPFDIYDMVGMKTPLEMGKEFEKEQDENSPYDYKKINEILEEKIEQNKLGRETGEGFYKYDEDGNKIK
ncbi:MAG: 3-hydroxyacyl-CoA dehydrogenase [Finegoldia sp.]|nr:3-hydroxyacyl-CoA dehydrogenase [Finegoldia sp.]